MCSRRHWPCRNSVHAQIWPYVTNEIIGHTTTVAIFSIFVHYSNVMMSAMASQITGVLIVCLNVCSVADQRKHQSSMSLAFVWGIHRWLVNSPHKGPVTPKMFPFDDVIMEWKSSDEMGPRTLRQPNRRKVDWYRTVERQKWKPFNRYPFFDQGYP